MKSLGISQIAFEVEIRASLQDTWQGLVYEISTWWPKSNYMSPKTQGFYLEPKPGGRMYEDYGNEEGLLWGEVVVLDGPHHLEIRTHLSPQYGGPAFGFLKLILKEVEGGTQLSLTDVSMGTLTEKTISELTAGWRFLFAETFKQYMEA